MQRSEQAGRREAGQEQHCSAACRTKQQYINTATCECESCQTFGGVRSLPRVACMWHHVGNPLRCVLFGVYIEILRLFFWGVTKCSFLGFFFCGTGGATKNAFLGFFFFAEQEAQRKMHFWVFLRARFKSAA
jgi:hypothetical protein